LTQVKEIRSRGDERGERRLSTDQLEELILFVLTL
jgi:hypothetical protein